MSDMPSAREHALQDLRRKRGERIAAGVFAASFLAFAVSGLAELIVLTGAALLALLATPSWIGVAPRYPVPSWPASSSLPRKSARSSS